MMDTYWLEGIRGSIHSPVKNEIEEISVEKDLCNRKPL